MQRRHVDTQQAAAKANFECLGTKEFNGCRCASNTRYGGIDERLHLGSGHVGPDLTRGHCAYTVGQGQGVSHIAGCRVDRDALQLSCSTFALADVAGFDHRKTQAAKVAGDIGHIDFGQRTSEGQHKSGLAIRPIRAH